MAIGQLTMQQPRILHCTFRFYNCINCDQLHVKICPAYIHTYIHTCIHTYILGWPILIWGKFFGWTFHCIPSNLMWTGVKCIWQKFQENPIRGRGLIQSIKNLHSRVIQIRKNLSKNLWCSSYCPKLFTIKPTWKVYYQSTWKFNES